MPPNPGASDPAKFGWENRLRGRARSARLPKHSVRLAKRRQIRLRARRRHRQGGNRVQRCGSAPSVLSPVPTRWRKFAAKRMVRLQAGPASPRDSAARHASVPARLGPGGNSARTVPDTGRFRQALRRASLTECLGPLDSLCDSGGSGRPQAGLTGNATKRCEGSPMRGPRPSPGPRRCNSLSTRARAGHSRLAQDDGLYLRFPLELRCLRRLPDPYCC